MAAEVAERIAVLEAKQEITDKKLDKISNNLDELLGLFTMAKGIRWFFLVVAGIAVFIGLSGLKAMLVWTVSKL